VVAEKAEGRSKRRQSLRPRAPGAQRRVVAVSMQHPISQSGKKPSPQKTFAVFEIISSEVTLVKMEFADLKK
jgi:hypothetical protein